MQSRLNILSAIILIFALIAGCTKKNTLDRYQPISPDEMAIIEVSKINQEALKNKDLAGHLATYHDNASIMIWVGGNTTMVSKKHYAEWLPNRARWGTPGVRYNIKIAVSGDKADFKGWHETNEGYRGPVSSVYVKENDTWYIMESRFGQYQ